MTNVTVLKNKLFKPTVERERITPATAVKMLEKNTANRSLSQVTINRYAGEMKKGQWNENNGETIKVRDDGVIVDGQHRLWAIVEADVTLNLLVVRGLDDEAFKTIDIGKVRTTGDLVGIAGIKNGNQISAGVTLILTYKKKKMAGDNSAWSKNFLRSDIIQFCIDNSEQLQASVRGSMNNGCCPIVGSTAILVGMHFLLCTVSKAPQREQLADEFFKQLGTGLFDANVEAHRHPIRVLRERLIANRQDASRLQAGIVAAFVVKAWNAYVGKKALSALRMTQGEKFPVIA